MQLAYTLPLSKEVAIKVFLRSGINTPAKVSVFFLSGSIGGVPVHIRLGETIVQYDVSHHCYYAYVENSYYYEDLNIHGVCEKVAMHFLHHENRAKPKEA